MTGWPYFWISSIEPFESFFANVSYFMLSFSLNDSFGYWSSAGLSLYAFATYSFTSLDSFSCPLFTYCISWRLICIDSPPEDPLRSPIAWFSAGCYWIPASVDGLTTFTAVSSPLLIISSTSSGLLGFSDFLSAFLSSIVMYSFVLECWWIKFKLLGVSLVYPFSALGKSCLLFFRLILDI